MDFVAILSIFVLACFVGYYVVWSVTPALHTPLMAVTNAISSVIIVGALIAGAAAGSASSKWLGLLGRGAGQHQHLRRIRGHQPHAGDVQKEGPAGAGQTLGNSSPRPWGPIKSITLMGAVSRGPASSGGGTRQRDPGSRPG
jgi:hypothetical protein